MSKRILMKVSVIFLGQNSQYFSSVFSFFILFWNKQRYLSFRKNINLLFSHDLRNCFIWRKENFVQLCTDFNLSLFRKIINKKQTLLNDIYVVCIVSLKSKLIVNFAQKIIFLLNVQLLVNFSVVDQILMNFLAGLMRKFEAFRQFICICKIVFKTLSFSS